MPRKGMKLLRRKATRPPKGTGAKDGTPDEGEPGAPTFYVTEHDRIAKRLAMLGFTDKQIADAFEVAERTINKWKAAHPSFRAALKKGKALADGKVVESLYARALGYSHPAVKIHVTKDGRVLKIPYIERYAPDTIAAIFWLKNRQPELWRDRPVESAPEPQATAAEIRKALKAMDEADGPQSVAKR